MTTIDDDTTGVFDNIQATRDALTVKRVFGDAYEVDGITIIPVARVAGGAGGGGGEGGEGAEAGSGFGTGFGMGAIPIGVYEVRDGQLEWKPSVDVNRIARGGQALAGLLVVCVTIIAALRSRR